MATYLRIHRFKIFWPPSSFPLPRGAYSFSVHGLPGHAHMAHVGYRDPKFLRAVAQPKLIIRIDGNRIGSNTYDDFDKNCWISGPDIGVRWPEGWTESGEGPRVKQSWYEIQPGEHQFELSVVNGWWVEGRKPPNYYRHRFTVGRDGVYTVSCQWVPKGHPGMNEEEGLILIRGESVKVLPWGMIFPSGDPRLMERWR